MTPNRAPLAHTPRRTVPHTAHVAAAAVGAPRACAPAHMRSAGRPVWAGGRSSRSVVGVGVGAGGAA